MQLCKIVDPGSAHKVYCSGVWPLGTWRGKDTAWAAWASTLCLTSQGGQYVTAEKNVRYHQMDSLETTEMTRTHLVHASRQHGSSLQDVWWYYGGCTKTMFVVWTFIHVDLVVDPPFTKHTIPPSPTQRQTILIFPHTSSHQQSNSISKSVFMYNVNLSFLFY